MPDPWPLSAASRWPVVAVATGLLLAGAAVWGGGGTAAPPPREPTATVRERLGAPEVGSGLSGVVRVRQSLLPEALARAAALPGTDVRGRFWVRSADAWRLELQGTGHDFQVVRSGPEIQIYDDARQRLITVPVALLPDGLAAVGPTRVAQGRPTTIAGRPAHVLRYRPLGRDVLLREVEVGVDAATGVPLSLRVFARDREEPVVDAQARSADEQSVPAERVRLEPPAGATTVPLGALGLAARLGTGPLRTVGRGWERVLVLDGGLPGGAPGQDEQGDGTAVLRTPIASLVTLSAGGRQASGVGLLPPERVAEAMGR
jgi:hypothetical protein